MRQQKHIDHDGPEEHQRRPPVSHRVMEKDAESRPDDPAIGEDRLDIHFSSKRDQKMMHRHEEEQHQQDDQRNAPVPGNSFRCHGIAPTEKHHQKGAERRAESEEEMAAFIRNISEKTGTVAKKTKENEKAEEEEDHTCDLIALLLALCHSRRPSPACCLLFHG